METKANYVLIGAFTLAGLLGAFGFLLWLAKVDVDRQFAYFDVLFENVSGLSTAGDVRYNGLPVGRVVGMDLDDQDPSKVRVRIEVSADTPVKIDTVATLQSQGVTGVSYVALSGGSPASDPLPRDGVIPSRRSPLQTIFEGAPELMEKAVSLLEDVNAVVNDENREAVTELLANLATASGRLDQVLSDFEGLSDDLGSAAREIAGFTGRLDELADTAETTLTTATDTLGSARVAADGAVETLDSAKTAFATADGLMQGELRDFVQRGASVAQKLDDLAANVSDPARATVEAAKDLLETRLPELIGQVQQTAETLDAQASTLGADASALMSRYQDVGKAVQARVEQTETALAEIEKATVEATATIESIRRTSDRVGAFVETDLQRLAQTDLPALLDDIGDAARTANEVLAKAGGDFTRISDVVSDQGNAALTTATQTFSNANDTLAAITDAMDSAQSTLGTAEQTFASVNTVIDEDIDPVIADLRVAMQSFTETVNTVTDRVDTISGEVLSASQSASNLVGTVDGIVQQNRRQFSDFLRVGLPQFQRFVEESRRLVVNLERLVDRVERDPARFLLGTQSSDFRR